MKNITLILTLLITLVLTSCEDMGVATNSNNCKNRFDVKLIDGGAMWVYNGSVTVGYLCGLDEMGHKVYIPLTQIVLITKVECDNRK